MRKPAAVLPVLVLVAGVALLAWWAGESADYAPPPPSEPDSSISRDYADDEEDAVMEVEDMLLDLAQQIVRRAWGGAMYHVAADFEGSPFLPDRETPGPQVGGVRFASSGPDPRRVDRAGFRESLTGIDLNALVFKLPSARLEGDRLAARLKLDGHSRKGRRAKRWVVQGDAEFARSGGRWLLRRWRATEAKTEEGEVRFLDVTAALGLTVPRALDPRPGAEPSYATTFLGGIAAGDFDNDGDADLYFPRVGRNYLFRNDGGRFTECAAELGAADPDDGAGALFLDVDNDGDLDLLVTNHEPRERRGSDGQARPTVGRRALVLYRNEGGRFTDVTAAAGLSCQGPATSACAADVDADGDLDLFVCMYEDNLSQDPRKEAVVPSTVYDARDGRPDQLWINRGDGTFREEARRRGVDDAGWGLAAAFADYDADGDPDLYLANDYGTHRLFRNRGDGFFEDATRAAGAGDTGFGMGVTWFDFDADGDLDLYVSNMYSTAGNRILGRGPGALSPENHRTLLKMARGNTLFRNRGDGTFEDVTASVGGGRAGWAWSSAAFDHDNDSTPDLYVANGFRTSAFATSDL